MFRDNNFYDCEADEDGGAVFFHNVAKIDYEGGYIEGRAGERGGGIYFHCDEVNIWETPEVDCEMTLRYVTFDRCSARLGGGVFWNFVEPNMG